MHGQRHGNAAVVIVMFAIWLCRDGSCIVAAQSPSCTCDTVGNRDILLECHSETNGALWRHRWDVNLTVCDWSGVSCSGDVITAIVLQDRNLSGTLTKSLALLDSLIEFNVSGNPGLVGSLPASFANWSYLKIFDVSNCSISGTIPPEYGSGWNRSFVHFNVKQNHMSGTLPGDALALWRTVQWVYLAKNNFTGTLPRVFSQWEAVETFDVDFNSFTGSLPVEYRAWQHIISFGVENNQLSGTLPAEYRAWTRVRYFKAGRNLLSGSLPPEYASMTELFTFRVWSNYLSGGLPSEYKTWSLVRNIVLASNRFNGTIPTSWGGTFHSIVTTMMFSDNQLTGTIPAGLMASSMRFLFLDRNGFTGSVPSSWGQWLPVLSVLLLQGNSQLGGVLTPSTPPAVFVATCGSRVCYSSLPSTSIIICVSAATISLLADNPSLDLVTRATVAQQSSVCGHSRVTATASVLQPTTHRALTDGSESVEVQRLTVTYSLALAVSSLVGFVTSVGGGLTAADDVQMLSGVVTSPCACRDDDARGSHPTTTSASLSSSPFAPLGSTLGVMFGNIALMVLSVGLPLLAVWCHQQSRQPHRRRCQTSPLTWSEIAFSTRTIAFRKTLHFPNVGCAACMFLTAGVVRSSISLVTAQQTPGDVAIGSVGVAVVVCIIFAVDVVYYRWRIDHGEILWKGDTTVFPASNRAPCFNTTQLAYTLHRESRPHLHYTGAPRWLPSAVLDVVMPCGTWAPPEKKATVGALVAPFQAQHRHLWRLAPAANIVVHVLNAVVPGVEEPWRGNACDALQGLTILVCVATSGVVLWVVPHRATLLSVCAALQSALVALVALLQLLCRGGHVGRVGVATAATVVSVVLGVVKLYHFMLPRMEKWWARHPSGQSQSSFGAKGLGGSTKQMVATKATGTTVRGPGPLQQQSLPTAAQWAQKTPQQSLIQLVELIVSHRNGPPPKL